MTVRVAHVVENFLSQCESSLIYSDESLQDYIVMRLESIITNIEELIQCVGTNIQLNQLRYRAQNYLRRFRPFSSLCALLVTGINMPTVVRHVTTVVDLGWI